MPEIDPRDFGRLESEVEGLKELVRAQTAAIAAINTQLSVMNSTLAEARGGWRTLMWLGGASAAAGGFISWVLQHMSFKP